MEFCLSPPPFPTEKELENFVDWFSRLTLPSLEMMGVFLGQEGHGALASFIYSRAIQ